MSELTRNKMQKTKKIPSRWNRIQDQQLIQWALLVVVVIGFTWLLTNRINQSNPENYGLETQAAGEPMVRFVYLIPSDQVYNQQYFDGISHGAKTLNDWYYDQLGNYFKFKVESYVLPHDSAYYFGSGATWDYYQRSIADGFALTGGYFNDPNNRWIFLNAAPIGATQGAGGTAGVALLTRDDIEGLSSSKNGRWIGGLGHELGHSFNLPHPAGCPYTGDCEYPIMYMGYSIFPGNSGGRVYLTDLDKTSLLNSTQTAQFFYRDGSRRRALLKKPQNPKTDPKLMTPQNDRILKKTTK